jgi:uncharacterized protein YjaZ
MGVVNTDLWLKENIENPEKICKEIFQTRDDKEAKRIYQYLVSFGMYQPNKRSLSSYNNLLEKNTWIKLKSYYVKYKEKWNGPDIPIYLFPFNNQDSFLWRNTLTKSGVSFSDKIFLFINTWSDDRELEALFVHEYHHSCRMQGLKKSIKDYTLLDSIILEGLAEDAVYENVGKEFVAQWSYLLESATFQSYWKLYLKDQLTLKKTDDHHDKLLYGKGKYPKMLGYTSGFHIVRSFRKENYFSTKTSFVKPSKEFIIPALQKD